LTFFQRVHRRVVLPTVKLTARTVGAARPPASGRLELFDEDLPGFCIRVTPNDRRTACVFYRVGPRLHSGPPADNCWMHGTGVATSFIEARNEASPWSELGS
jgi:hypothetical protein